VGAVKEATPAARRARVSVALWTLVQTPGPTPGAAAAAGGAAAAAHRDWGPGLDVGRPGLDTAVTDQA
jgi:hypothetical protein